MQAIVMCVCMCVTLLARSALLIAQLSLLPRLKVHFHYFEDVYNLLRCHVTLTFVVQTFSLKYNCYFQLICEKTA